MRNKIKNILIILSAVIALALIVVFVLVLKIGRITCQSQYGPCSDLVNNIAQKSLGKGIFIAINDLKKNITQTKSVSQYSIRYNIPNSLLVYVVEKKGEIAVTKQGTNRLLIVDKDGQIISEVKNTSLPTINYLGDDSFNYKIGDNISENLFFAENVSRLSFSTYGTRNINLFNDRIEFNLKDGKKIIMPSNGEEDVLFGSLALILSRLNNNLGEIRIGEIDLRYKNPVVR